MPVGVQCPISSSLGEFPAIGIGSGVLDFRPYWCPSPFPLLSILGVFHSLLSTIGFQSCFFFMADVSPPIRSQVSMSVCIYVRRDACVYVFMYALCEVNVFFIYVGLLNEIQLNLRIFKLIAATVKSIC